MTNTAGPTLESGISARIERLTATDRRIARVILDDPGAVAFGTAASFAKLTGAGVGSIHRLALQLGYTGFSDLQAQVQREISQRLRPAAERIKTKTKGDALDLAIQTETGNVSRTLIDVDRKVLSSAVKLLSNEEIGVYIASGNSSAGVALHLSEELRLLRHGVTLLSGNPVNLSAQIAVASDSDLLIVIDFHRYDRWLVELARNAVDHGLEIISIADSILAPFAKLATCHFTVSARSETPFDSHVGTLALCSLLVGSVATHLRRGASHRLDAVEQDWISGNHLTAT